MVHKVESRTVKIEFDKDAVRDLARKLKHEFFDRGTYFELVRLYGDQVDSRVRIDFGGDAHWTFWTEGDGTTDEDFFKITDKKKMKEVLTKANRLWEAEVRKRGGDVEDW